VTTSVGSDTETKTDYITVSAEPTAAFSGTPRSGDRPLTVHFSDESDAGSSSIASWAWNFGDGGTSSAQNPSHIYTSAGTYTVSLTVTTSVGSDTETKTGYITVDGGGSSTLVLQPNASSGKDTYASSRYSSTNYGDSVNMRSGFSFDPETSISETARTYIWFDLSDIPAGAQITSARLELWGQAFGEGTITIGARYARSLWSESSLTWDNKPDYSSSNLDTDGHSAGYNGWWIWDVTGMVGDWFGGTANNGFCLVSTNESAVGIVGFLTSALEQDLWARPKLTIEYSTK